MPIFMEDYKLDEVQRTTNKEDHSDLYSSSLEPLCEKLIKYYEMKKSIFIKSAVSEITQALNGLPMSDYGVFVKFNIPQIVSELFFNTQKADEFRPSAFCIIQIYMKSLDCRPYFESPEFIKQLIISDQDVTSKFDFKLMILHSVVSNTRDPTFHYNLSTILSLDQLILFASKTFNDETLQRICDITRTLSKFIDSQELEAKLLRFIRENLGRDKDQQRSSRIILEMLSEMIMRHNFPREEFVSLGFNDLILKSLHLFKDDIGYTAANFISLYIENISVDFPVDYDFIFKLLSDSNIYNNNQSFASTCAKIISYMVVNTDDGLSEFISSGMFINFLNNYQIYPAAIQNYLYIASYKAMFKMNLDNYHTLLDSLSDKLTIFNVIAAGIETEMEYVVVPAIYALYNVLLIANNNPDEQEFIFSNITNIISYDDLCDLDMTLEDDNHAALQQVFQLQPYLEYEQK